MRRLVFAAAVAALAGLAAGTAVAQGTSSGVGDAMPIPAMRANGPMPKMSGFIQVVITRAVTLRSMENGAGVACMPIVAVRNETPESVDHITVEITYIGKTGEVAHSSTVHEDVDRDEENHAMVEPLYIGPCQGAVGVLHVRLCMFEEGTDCRKYVEPSGYGAIPLKAAPPPKEASATKSEPKARP